MITRPTSINDHHNQPAKDIKHLLTTVFIFFLISSVSSAEDTPPQGTYTLGEIVVRGKTDGVEATAPVTTITEADIRDSGAKTLNEAIELVPGIDIFTGGDGTPRINIRGFRTRHVILLLDGIPLNSAYDQQFDPSLIPVESIEKIKISRGPSSVLYGQGGLGGVINIVSKKGAQDTTAMIGGEIGEGDMNLYKATASSGNDLFSFFVSGSSYEHDAYPLSKDFEPTEDEDGGDRLNSDRKRNNIFGNLGYTPNDTINLGLTISVFDGAYGIPDGVINPDVNDDPNFPDDPDSMYAPNQKRERLDDILGYSIQLAGEYFFSESFSLRTWIFFNQMENNYRKYRDATFSVCRLDVDQTADVKGIAVQPRYDFETFGSLCVKLSMEKNTWDSNGYELGSYIPAAGQFERILSNTKGEYTSYSSAIEYETNPLPEMGVTLGYARHTQKKSGGTYTYYKNTRTYDSRKDDENVFLIGTYYDLSKNIRLKAAFNRNIRLPSIRQLYSFEEGGIPELKAEHVYHYTGGLQLRLPRNIDVMIDAYQSKAKNFIEKDQEGIFFANFEKYQFRGVEIAIDIKTIQNLMLRTSYTFQRTKDLGNPEIDELQNRPENRAALETKYTFSFGLSAYFSVLYVADQTYYSKRPLTKPEDPSNPDSTKISYTGKRELKSYTLINTKISQALLNEQLTLYVGAKNIFDIDYAQSFARPQSGRFFYCGVELRYK